MNIQFDSKNKEQKELIAQMGSKNMEVSARAQEAFAELSAPIVSEVIQQAATTSMIYKDFSYNEDENPSLPLDLYLDAPEGTVTVWSQNWAGGLASSEVVGLQELKFSTFRLDSAVNLKKKYVRRSYLPVVAKALERMAQELLIKVEYNGWNVLLKAVGEARTNGSNHIVTAGAANVLKLDDFSRLITKSNRINQSWAGGTPISQKYGATDLFMSPEMIEQIRAWTYNPMNTKVGATTTTPGSGTDNPGLALPDAVRQNIYDNAGMASVYGKTIHTLWELGTSQKYNYLFGQYAPASIAPGGGNFSATGDEIILAINLNSDSFWRPIAQNADSGASFVVSPDDQWTVRDDKIGFFTSAEMGFLSIDARNITALIV